MNLNEIFEKIKNFFNKINPFNEGEDISEDMSPADIANSLVNEYSNVAEITSILQQGLVTPYIKSKNGNSHSQENKFQHNEKLYKGGKRQNQVQENQVEHNEGMDLEK